MKILFFLVLILVLLLAAAANGGQQEVGPTIKVREAPTTPELLEYHEYKRRLAAAAAAATASTTTTTTTESPAPQSPGKLIETAAILTTNANSPFPFNIHLCKDPPAGHDGIYVNFYCTALLVLWLMAILSLCLYQFRAILGIRRALEISPCFRGGSDDDKSKSKGGDEDIELLEPYPATTFVELRPSTNSKKQ